VLLLCLIQSMPGKPRPAMNGAPVSELT